MVSYIYGVIYPIDELVAFCKERGIILVEDIAESYIGNHYIGHQDAAMSLFSFGSIKRYTSFGGALAFIRNKLIFETMNAIHEQYPRQKKKECLRKIMKVAAMGLLLNNQPVNLYAKKVFLSVGFDYKEFVVKNLRGFAPKGDFLAKFRKKPAAALLNFMLYRLKNFDPKRFADSNGKLQKAVQKLVAEGVTVPGHAIQNRSFWLFPVIVPEVKTCSDMLNKRGVDAYLGATQLKPVHPIDGYKKPLKMYSFFDKVCFGVRNSIWKINVNRFCICR